LRQHSGYAAELIESEEVHPLPMRAVKVMRFLIDEDLPRSIKDLAQVYGHEAIDLRDIGFRGSTDRSVAALAKAKSCAC